jgi:hypothetical protein
VISGLVLDELAYRSVLAWLRYAGDKNPLATYRGSTTAVMRRMRSRLDRLCKAIDQMGFDFASTDRSVARQAIGLMSNPGLAPRDAFHAAHALDAGCSVIVSSDPVRQGCSFGEESLPPIVPAPIRPPTGGGTTEVVIPEGLLTADEVAARPVNLNQQGVRWVRSDNVNLPPLMSPCGASPASDAERIGGSR